MKNNTPDYSFLFQQKCQEYDMLNDEYQEMKDISSQIEKELENEVEHLTKEKQRLLAENERVQNQIKELKKKYSSEIIYLEKKMDILTGDNTRIQEDLRTKNRIITQNEIELERLESQLRESQCIINDLEYKIDHTLEKLAMVQSQLEENKAYNEEEVQRLKDKLRESQSEVLAYRTREAKLEQSSRMEAENNANVYIDEATKYYAAYQAEGKRDPSPIKKLKIELGKRSYGQLTAESYNRSKRAQDSNHGPVFHKPKNFGSKTNNAVSFSVNNLRSAQNNAFQDNLRDLYSLNMMNKANNKSLLIVNDLIGELDKQSRKVHNFNLQNNQNVNPNIMGINNENQDLFKTNVNLSLDQNNFGNIFSQMNQQPTFTNFFENA